jgi:hypothetical protein
MARKPIAQGIGKLIKAGLRKAYQGKTAPLQAGSKLANRLAPNSKVAATLAAIASPAMLQEGPPTIKSAPRRDSPEQAPTQPRPSAQGDLLRIQEARLQLGSVPDQDPVLVVEQLEALSLLIYLEMIWHQFQEMPLAKLKE